MKTIQKSPLVHVWSLVAALIAAVGVVVALAQPALASAENAYSVTISTVDEQPTVLYTNTVYSLGRTRISALKVLAKAGVVNPGKVQKLTANPKGAVTTVAPESTAMDPSVSSDDLLFVVKRQAAKVVLTVTYGDAQTALKLKLACVPSQIASSDTISEDESNAPPAETENGADTEEGMLGQESVLGEEAAQGEEGASDEQFVPGDSTTAEDEAMLDDATVVDDPASALADNYDAEDATLIGDESSETSEPTNGVSLNTQAAGEEVAQGEEAENGKDVSPQDDGQGQGGRQLEEITISFDKNSDDAEGEMKNLIISAGVATPLSPCGYSRDGFDFVGWNTQADGKGTSYQDGASVTLSEDTTLYAQWQQSEEITISFDKNSDDAEGEMKNLIISAGVATPLSPCGYSRDGFDFVGWNTQADGKGTSYQDGASVTLSEDTTLYAQWKQQEGTLIITFVKNADDAEGEMAKQVLTKGTSPTLDANQFTRKGYIFARWNSKADGTGNNTFVDETTLKIPVDYAANVMTLYAQWAEPITITFKKNASDAKGTMANQEVPKGYPTKLNANAFARSDYTFIGWNTQSDGSGEDYKDAAKVTFDEDTTLYALWQAEDTLIITFKKNADDAEGTMAKQVLVKGERVQLDANQFTRKSYAFACWNDKADGSGDTSLMDGATVRFKEGAKGKALTLYAQWGEPVTITFDKNASDAKGTMAKQVVAKDYAAKLTANAFTRKGYTFAGWKTKKGTAYDDGEKVTFTADTTLYAQWKEGSDDTVTITFEANGGKGTMDPITKKKEYDEDSGKDVAKVKLPDCTFTLSGHTFTGWNTKEDGSGQALDAGKTYKFPKDYTLYAQWKEGSGDTITVTFDANEGEGTMKPVTGKKGEAIKLPNCSFTRDGYHFTGWNTAADGSGQALKAGGSYKFPKDYTLYAQWAEGSGVLISFDANGGEGEMDDVVAQPGETITLPSNEFQYEGYYFTGWNTAADGSGTAIGNGARIKVPSSDVTLYAQWKEGSEIQTKKPVVATSAGGNYTSRTTDIAFAIGQEIPADATYARIWFDLDEAMSFTTAASVRIQNGDVIDNAKISINGQYLEVVIDDPATIEGLRGKMVRIDFKARVRDDVDLSEYEEDEDGVAYIPYQAFAEFRGAETRTVESEEKSLRIRFSTTSNTTSRTNGSSSSNGTTSRNNNNTAAAKRNSSLAKTGDPTSMAAVVTAVLGGASFVMAGLRRRK